MPFSVIDVASNEEENVKRWAKALKGGGAKLKVFETIYSGKRRVWSAKDISQSLGPSYSTKRVTEVGKQLVRDTLANQVSSYPVVYEKIDHVHHRKRQLLSLASSKERRAALATKREPKVAVKVVSNGIKQRLGRAILLTLDDIDQFAQVRLIRRTPLLRPLPENRFKSGLQKLFQDTGIYKDWGGERSDFFTHKLKIKGRRHAAAFALKGPGVGVRTMTLGRWGKHGSQIQRLVSTPADVFILQFEGQIDEDSIEQLKKLTEAKAYQEQRTLYYGYLDRDDCARLRFAYSAQFTQRKQRSDPTSTRSNM